MADEEESSETISNVTAHPDVRTIFVELLGEVKKMNENFTNISYVDEEESLLSSTDNNKDQAASDNDGVRHRLSGCSSSATYDQTARL